MVKKWVGLFYKEKTGTTIVIKFGAVDGRLKEKLEEIETDFNRKCVKIIEGGCLDGLFECCKQQTTN